MKRHLVVALAASVACSCARAPEKSASSVPDVPPSQEAKLRVDGTLASQPPPPPPVRTKAAPAQGYSGSALGGVEGGVVGGVVGGVIAPSAVPLAYAGQPPGTPIDTASSNFPAAGRDFNTEEYGRIVENPFLEATANPLSTFGVDVDRASYALVRRFVDSGSLPPRDAVRIEELVNYFEYDYPDPSGTAPFSITTELASCPWNPANKLMRIGLQGRRMDVSELPPNNLVFLIDVSGSMDSPDKLPLLKSALGMLVDNLRAKDRVAIVVYAGNAGLVLPSTSGAEKGRIWSAIDRLQAGGSTAGGQGIVLAYETAKESFLRGGNNRVILATDGDFNVGVTSDGELERLIEEKRRSGIFLSVLGFGTGNIKDSKMELLADKGNGNYAYIDTPMEAKKVLVSEMGGTLLTIAKDVKLQIEFNPARVAEYRLIGYENRMLRAEDFNDDRKDAGEIGAGHSVTALYEIVPASAGSRESRIDPLKYQKRAATDAAGSSAEIATVKIRYKDPAGDTSRLLSQPVPDNDMRFELASDDMQFAASVAEMGLLLRDSQFKANASFDHVLRVARKAQGRDAAGYRGDFVRLAEKTSRLKGTEVARVTN